MKECQVCKSCYSDDVASCPKDGSATTQTLPGEPVLEGKYQIEYRLGQGGMGIVYKARHAYLKTQLAIKVILPDLVGNDPQLVTRFRQEALAAAAIRHQNVVSVTDYGVIDGTVPFLVMEYVEGESLHDLLARVGKLQPDEALDLISAVCAGVGAAHHQGIVHRDLKPLNIMICSDKPNMSQAVKILDFGLAKIKSGELLGSFIQAQTTGLMGSPYYMAPEQWADEEPDSRADIYSLGVMLYQMLAGDVPFKGSSIPAIMKKHISDPAPTLAAGGVPASPDLEAAIAHALQKDHKKRTPTVEAFVNELTSAIRPRGTGSIGKVTQALPVSSVKILSKPPKASVFVDNVSVGETRENGILLLEGMQSGNHHLRVSHDGFQDWLGDIVCDGTPKEVVAELRKPGEDSKTAIPKPDVSIPGGDAGEFATVVNRKGVSDQMAQTVQQNWSPGTIITPDGTVFVPKKKTSGLLLGIGAIFALLLVGALGVAIAYFSGAIGGSSNVKVAPAASPTPEESIVADLVSIPGGTFMMGRDDGREPERPAHQVTVEAFEMDRTEVTNREYYQFIRETGYRPVPAHWVNDRPVPEQEKMPVRFVNQDDIKAFADWRSKRDGTIYRLPTEAEWEYAARSGVKNFMFPWGNDFDPKCAVTDKDNTEPEAVGTASCPNEWGVVDLIGNVYEWTGSKAALYPGNKGTIRETKEPRFMIRGGAALNKSSGEFAVTSTFRADVEASKRDKELGFRLVTQSKPK
ncbi:MAG: SUMF1/EgtB/PvdO family nonheme iron enzyme [Acidobacteriota bacterium]|nr:MAG: SUMF1/EgtB/PvdO family nonheme iron enzyme [Acidobacteriota bacterium]